MPTEKTQKGNPRGLTTKQHVFPRQSIQRFANASGFVAVRLLAQGKTVPLQPDDPLFCARRAWDQRAERGYMRKIENAFEPVAARVAGGGAALNPAECALATEFSALWRRRFHHRGATQPDLRGGVKGDPLTLDQRECLEMNGYSFVGADDAMPGRMFTGLRIQLEIGRLTPLMDGHGWGVARAADGEFLLPDNFGNHAIIPVSPKAFLIWGSPDASFGLAQVADLNRFARSSSVDYLAARDFAACPL
jgi:hypothetical protein